MYRSGVADWFRVVGTVAPGLSERIFKILVSSARQRLDSVVDFV